MFEKLKAMFVKPKVEKPLEEQIQELQKQREEIRLKQIALNNRLNEKKENK